MAPFNVKLAHVALANINRSDSSVEKRSFTPADSAGVMPVDPGAGGMPPGMSPDMMMGGGGGGGMDMGGMPPDGGMPPGGGGAPPPEAGGGGGGPIPGGPTDTGGSSIGEQLQSLNSKMDQVIGVVNGFLMGQQAGGGSKGGGGGAGNVNQQMLATLQSIASAVGAQPPAGAASGGTGAPGEVSAPGMPTPGNPMGGATMPLLGPPGAGGPLGQGMSVSASVRPNRNGSPADQISRIIKDLRR